MTIWVPGTHTLLVEMQNYIAPLEKDLTISHKVKHNLPYDPTTPLLGLPKRNRKLCSHKTCTQMLTALFITAPN